MEAMLEVHVKDRRVFGDAQVDAVPVSEKLKLLQRYCARLERQDIKTWSGHWLDQRRDRRFVSSLGADVRTDYQEAGVQLHFSIAAGEQSLQEIFSKGAHRFSEIAEHTDANIAELDAYLDKCARFVAGAQAVTPGQYPVILSPKVAGVFAHESFGHKSEADFMLGDPAMLEDWKIGSRIGPDMLNIVDDGEQQGSGWAPFDDEGQRSKKTYLIKNGLLTGRLHAAHTAAALNEECTGNARAISFRFEPIVRMTTTWIEPGELSQDELFSGVEDGFFIESYKHGSGMSTFTIAPSLAWRIKDGKVTEPVRIAVITGSVFETMGEIDGLSDTIERPFLLGGGCGKFEQWPLSVGFGGPFVRIRRMTVA
jgi:TldD protein